MRTEIPTGYKFSGVKKNKLGVGLIYSEQPVLCVAAFTKNLLKSNSIIVSQNHLNKSESIRCIIANSGCANTACGKDGLKTTYEICISVAKELNVKPEEVLIASTGVIGEPLPKFKIINIIRNLVLSLDKNKSSVINFAKSIMTTDTKHKVLTETLKIGDEEKKVLCIAKGAGMISPELKLYKPHATMLVFLITDLSLSKAQMLQIMNKTIIPVFNSFSIDGDTSPNDTIFFVAQRGNNLNKKDFIKVNKAVDKISKEMVLKLLFDGEGVTKVIKIIIKNCNREDAQLVAKTISSSLLVKTAFYGADPNWGRILSACGRSGVELDINKINIWIGKHQVVKNGTSCFVSDSILRREMLKNFFEIVIDLAKNRCASPYIFYTTDLSKKYVEINSKYKT